ncbi:ABC transporter permease [Alicyclobacillus tolerans]|uniref:ABC transporter permease n=1 Tax=Alicyclobacillus tolerans TaxID=90970 RepID=UPI001F349370|nr:ABC transporter permease [Alicyclobacillus tolerans]MCF8565868.1 ABC transporter permease [Alicyclobacillus tolerans]
MNNRSNVFIILISALTAVFLLLPLSAMLMHISWRSLWEVWSSQGRQAFFFSVDTTLVTMGIIVGFGTPLAWLMARGRHGLWKVVEYLMLIPLLIPPLVIGLLLIYVYGPYTAIGQGLGHFHLSATNTALAVVLAQVYEAIPYYIFAAQAAFNQVDRAFEFTSLSLGVSPLRTFTRVTLPLSLPGLLGGFTMAFARAIGAFGAVVVVAYYPRTLPISIWVALQEQGLPTALPLALLLLLVALPLPLAAVLWRRLHHDPLET